MQLRNVDHDAWAEIQELMAGAPQQPRILLANQARRDSALEALQVTTGSFLGAMVAQCGALVLDEGWLRMLGSGAEGLPGIHEANNMEDGPPPFLEVAWDVLGGRFAINGGALDADPGEVCYWGPDTLSWTGIGGGYSAFVTWAMGEGPTSFYSSLRWPSWKAETSCLAPHLGLSLYPPPFTTEGVSIANTTRSAVPIAELHSFYAEMTHQLASLPPETMFGITAKD